MANVNIAEWTPDQVAEWMSGLGPSVERYAAGLRARGLNGQRLLMLRCDDLEYFGVHIIGHQELLLEAVEHLRHFHYESRRECVQQLALAVSGAALSLARALRCAEALSTQALADVARLVRCVKPLACWLDRWPLCAGAALRRRRALLLTAALEASASAQRERFADRPARCVARAAAAAAATADYIVQDVSDPHVLAPADLLWAALRPGPRLGFRLPRAADGRPHLARLRFGSPAHASGHVRPGDELVQVGARCVVGWGGEAVLALCTAAAARGELQLRLRRRGTRPPPARLAPPPRRADSDESPPPSPGPDPDPEPPRLYPPRPQPHHRRRHTISCGSPIAKRPATTIEQFWRELQEQKSADGSPDSAALLYRRDKAVSCSTGLELSPRPRTCLGVSGGAHGQAHAQTQAQAHAHAQPQAQTQTTDSGERRGKLDKAHSTPAYDAAVAGVNDPASPPPPHTQSPADSPTIRIHEPDKADQILDFKKSSSQIGEAILATQRARPETVNTALIIDRAVSGESAAVLPAPEFPALRIVPRTIDTNDKKELSPLKPLRGGPAQISLPLRSLSKRDISVGTPVYTGAALPALNPQPAPPQASTPNTPTHTHTPQPTSNTSSGGRGIFPSAKTRSLKKKNSLLAKRRSVSWRALCGRGAVWAGGGGGSGGGGGEGDEGAAVLQRVRAKGAAASRWVRRYLLLAHNLLYAYREPECTRASCMINLSGFTVSGATEVKSKPHAFKVYHTGVAFYFAAMSREAMLSWLQLIHRATLAPAPPLPADLCRQYSETDYSDTESESERRPPAHTAPNTPDRHDDKGKFGSLKKLRSRMSRWESHETVAASSLDRKYLRFFYRHRNKDDKHKRSGVGVVVPTEQYRSYRRVTPSPSLSPSAPTAPSPADPSPSSPPPPSPARRLAASSHPELAERAPDHLLGFVTLQEFMLKKQEEDNRQVYNNRVLMGVERSASGNVQKELQKQLEQIVPDVIYGELPSESSACAPSAPNAPSSVCPSAQSAPGSSVMVSRALPAAPAVVPRSPPVPGPKPISVKGKDGYEKLVYPEELGTNGGNGPERRRDALRRNDKVQPGGAAALSPHATTPDSWGGGGGVSRLRLMFGARTPHRTTPTHADEAGTGLPFPGGTPTGAVRSPSPLPAVYPHLQCPPTFQPETYCLALASLPPPPPPS